MNESFMQLKVNPNPTEMNWKYVGAKNCQIPTTFEHILINHS